MNHRKVMMISLVLSIFLVLPNVDAIEFLDYPRSPDGDVSSQYPENNVNIQRLMPLNNQTFNFKSYVDVYPASELVNATMNFSILLVNSTHSISADNITFVNDTRVPPSDYAKPQNSWVSIGTWNEVNRTDYPYNNTSTARFLLSFKLPDNKMKYDVFYNISVGIANSSGYTINKTIEKTKIVSKAIGHSRAYYGTSLSESKFQVFNYSKIIQVGPLTTAHDYKGVTSHFKLNKSIGHNRVFEIAYNDQTTVNNLTSQVNRFFEISAPDWFETSLLWHYVEISYNDANLTGVIIPQLSNSVY